MKIFLYSSSVYSCHLFLISSASVRSLPFLSFVEPIFAWNVPLASLIFLKRSLLLLLLLLLLLSRFSRVRLCATPWTAAYQAPPSMGLSRQEYWSGVPLPSLVFPIYFRSSLNYLKYLIQGKYYVNSCWPRYIQVLLSGTLYNFLFWIFSMCTWFNPPVCNPQI